MSRQFCANTRKIYLASCLYDCIEDNNIRAVEKLLTDNGANPNIIIPGRGITPFHLAIGNEVEKTAEEITRLFLTHGGNPNVRSDEKLTPLHIAAAWGRANILNILLKCGGDPTLRDDQGNTALDYAREEEYWDIVDELENDLEPETQYDNLPYDITLDKVIINNGVLVAEYGVSGIDDRTLPHDLKTALVPLPDETINSYVENWCVKHADMIHADYSVSRINDLSNDKLILNRPHSVNSSDSDKDSSTNYFDNERLNRNYVSVRKKSNSKIEQAITDPKIPKENLNICLDFSSSDENNLNQKYETSPEKTEPYLIDKHVLERNALNDSFKYISSEESMVHNGMCKISGIHTLPSDSSHMISSYSVKDELNVCVINNSDVITKQSSSSSSSSEYLTCEDAKSINSLEKNILNSIMTMDITDKHPDGQNKYPDLTLDLSHPVENTNWTQNHLTNIPCQLSVLPDGPNETLISVAEEYKYIDKEEGIVLIEKRILTNQKLEDNKSTTSSISCAASIISSLPSVLDYDTDTLRNELTIRGEPPGPITKTTKRVYLKQLKKLKKTTVYIPPVKIECTRVYSVELEKTLRNPDWSNNLTAFKALEQMVVQQFSNPEPTKRWREGLTKASFTYLLLDPRVTNNLPGRSEKLRLEDTWKTFLSSIFYVGKGKRSRPYAHLYEAVTYWNKGVASKNSKKVKYILDVWKEQHGVICLHIFQNVIPVEAYTREAAMINALKLQNLCNSKAGDFYGVSATWPERQKRLLGVYLLYRAMLIFLNEGERQLRPDDIGK